MLNKPYFQIHRFSTQYYCALEYHPGLETEVIKQVQM